MGTDMDWVPEGNGPQTSQDFRNQVTQGRPASIEDDQGLLTPAAFSARLPSSPLVASPADDWDDIVLERFRHPLGTIDLPALHHHLIVDHLIGPALVENMPDTDRFERRWTGPGQVSVTPIGQRSHRVLRGRTDVILTFLSPELLRETAQEFDGRQLDAASVVPCFATPDSTADQLIRLLLAEAEAPGTATSLMAATLARALTVHLLRFHTNAGLQTPEPLPSITPLRLRRVIETMRSCMDEELTLERLAATAGLSPSHLARAFRGVTGQSPHRYLVGLRIEKAQKLLETTKLPIIEVGMQCGFGQPSHFATAFRKSTGHSPRAWRELRRS